MAKGDELGIYTATDADGVERTYQLTADEAKARGAKAASQPETKARTPQNKAAAPETKG